MTTEDNVDGLLEVLARRRKSRKGEMSITEGEIPVAAIYQDAPVQFRNTLSDETLAGMRETVESGGTLPSSSWRP